MTIKPSTSFNQQWHTLHDSIESYEQYALIIKLVSITLTVVSFTSSLTTLLTFFFLSILWFQEGIWKTYQARLNDAIINLESLREENKFDKEENSASINNLPLYSQWQKIRPGSVKLIKEYINNALKPTVVFPYLPLIIIILTCK